MDEPTAGIDVQARQLIWKTISSLTDSTTIVTSHALEEAVSSRLFIVAGGKLPFSGTSTEFREQFKCGYLLRVEAPNGAAGPVLSFVQSFIPEAKVTEDRKDTIALPIYKEIPRILREFEAKKEELAFRAFSLCVEQLEGMFLKLVMSGEAQFELETS
jgi:ABC-type multidrug transport system ATPase subunit